MKKGKRGFTLIEVSLFLAISGLLFLGVTIGVQNSIYQQRKNDTVQNFVEFLRGVYGEVTNVQNATAQGRSDQAMYGRLVTFGESHDLAGNPVASRNEAFVYTVIGKVRTSQSGAAKELLFGEGGLGANVVEVEKQGNEIKSVKLAGFANSYIPKWSAQIEPPCNGSNCDGSYVPLKGMLLIVRHPVSGEVYTYYAKDKVLEINDGVRTKSVNFDFLAQGFEPQQVDFCLNSEPGNRNSARIDVRIDKNARNASAVGVYGDVDNKCRGSV